MVRTDQAVIDFYKKIDQEAPRPKNESKSVPIQISKYIQTRDIEMNNRKSKLKSESHSAPEQLTLDLQMPELDEQQKQKPKTENTWGGKRSHSGRKASYDGLSTIPMRIPAIMQNDMQELKKLETQRNTQRRSRQKSMLPFVSLVGYTNAGKSTIMNMLLQHSKSSEEKMVFEEDMLFATLDTSIRHIDLADGSSFLLSDTVGFISELPHDLFEAFHSTLEEVRYASLLIQVVDVSNSDYHRQMEITQQTLQEIHASDIPMITVYNKCDQSDYSYPIVHDHEIYMSAKQQVGIEELLEEIVKN